MWPYPVSVYRVLILLIKLKVSCCEWTVSWTNEDTHWAPADMYVIFIYFGFLCSYRCWIHLFTLLAYYFLIHLDMLHGHRFELGHQFEPLCVWVCAGGGGSYFLFRTSTSTSSVRDTTLPSITSSITVRTRLVTTGSAAQRHRHRVRGVHAHTP